jgi:O-antigen ligase
MFITGGRAGQVMFFVMVAILIFQFFDRQRVKALFSIVVFIPLVFFTAYKTSPLFHDRVVLGVNSIIEYSQNTNYKSSIGYRLIFAENSWELIKKNPIFGVGTGDFPEEYKKINSLNTPSLPNITNPHNMYILVLSQLGLLGLFSMLTMVYYQIQLSFKENNRFYKDVGITLPILFLVIMWSDSYLLGHYTTLVYIFFSSFLYKRFD